MIEHGTAKNENNSPFHVPNPNLKVDEKLIGLHIVLFAVPIHIMHHCHLLKTAEFLEELMETSLQCVFDSIQ